MKKSKGQTVFDYALFVVLGGAVLYALLLTLSGCGESTYNVPGKSGKDGANGTNGTNGVDGKDGTNGTNGTDGQQGPAGSDAQIQIIQFCNGVSNYPSTFPEVGFCINNKLYAVYSANDGFLTLIPPGNYLSNAIGSSCNFTVLANCGISH